MLPFATHMRMLVACGLVLGATACAGASEIERLDGASEIERLERDAIPQAFADGVLEDSEFAIGECRDTGAVTISQTTGNQLRVYSCAIKIYESIGWEEFCFTLDGEVADEVLCPEARR